MVSLRRGRYDDVTRERARVGVLELGAVIGQQALRDELQQHVVVALKRHIDVEVGPQPHQPVFGDEPRAATGFARLLQDVESGPGGQRLQGCRESLEILAVLIGVGFAAEHGVELDQELVVREVHGVGRREARQQPPLVTLVIEDDLLVGLARGRELAALVAVGDRNRERHGRHRGGRTIERNATLHERAEHGEEATTGAVDG